MGYIGQKRSENSESDIENGIMPISMFTKINIQEHLSPDEFNKVLTFGISNFKKLAKLKVIPNSWHHTGKFYQQTDHYDVRDVYNFLDSMTPDDHKEFKILIKPQKPDIKYGYVLKQVWGGTRNYRRLIGESHHFGLIKGDYLTDKLGNRYKLSANSTIDYNSFDTLLEAKRGIRSELGLKVLKAHFPKVK